MVAYVQIEYSIYQFSEESKGGGGVVESTPTPGPRGWIFDLKRFDGIQIWAFEKNPRFGFDRQDKPDP